MELISSPKVWVYDFLNHGVTITKQVGANLYPDQVSTLGKTCSISSQKIYCKDEKLYHSLWDFQSDVKLSYNSHFALLNKVYLIVIGKKFKHISQSWVHARPYFGVDNSWNLEKQYEGFFFSLLTSFWQNIILNIYLSIYLYLYVLMLPFLNINSYK